MVNKAYLLAPTQMGPWGCDGVDSNPVRSFQGQSVLAIGIARQMPTR